ncbi:leucyl aminopeptidase [Sphingomonas astaxanthinifaciens]|uniref:Probable cytosol aminopeptidase n=1 Tax=Sphingomonas astaxanthinifaciens DSM 22298 TaxID=1123267 RepID=A0ABQ5Z6L8_9SPHN|nr:leucyl aminopeptidase [Sphingomonas astaxanthinifaciens]GLR46419.1 putative cytosol aminopeptidase [Sphingomonas astaxanthinifaciens DSM 22298]
MQIRFADQLPSGAYALVLPVAGPERTNLAALGEARAAVEASARGQRFEGEAGGVAETWIGGTGGAQVRRLLLVGTGNGSDGVAAEKLAGTAVARLLTSGERSLVIDLTGTRFDADAAARLALVAAARGWRYDRYRTRLKDKQKVSLEEVVIVGAPTGSEARYTERYAAVLDGLKLTRELVTEPANIIYAETFVERVRKAAEGSGLVIEALDEAAMKKLGMGALLGVNQGSIREPRLLVMRWNGGNDGDTPLGLIGKGVTFDTGGISIKPAAGMEAMKWDMGGAGAVAGAMIAIARRKAKANVIGFCGLVENMPSGSAQRPGDVVTSLNGQTIEVINTDAEGRLVLADVMTYAQREHGVKKMVDLATLTGAMLIALGHEHGGLFSNDDGLAGELAAAGAETGDKLWRMPLGDAYDRLIDSPIADIKNVGPREAGSITAAQFLQRFVEEGTVWAHLDIAGTVWSDKPGTSFDKGATGFGVRLLDRWVENVAG